MKFVVGGQGDDGSPCCPEGIKDLKSCFYPHLNRILLVMCLRKREREGGRGRESRGHTLDWLITSRATDILDLTVADMLLSDHFVISFDLLLRKPGRVTKKVTSRNIRSVDMYAFRTDLRNVLECVTLSESADPLSVYNTCLRQALDHHAPLVTRTMTDRTSAP